MTKGLARFCLVAAGLGLVAGAVLHVAVLVGGPDWIQFVGAPPSIVQSAKDGTWLAPASCLAIAALLAVLAAYAFSGAGLMPRPPLRGPLLSLFAAIFILRGLIIIPALMRGKADWTSPFDLFVVGSSAFILAIGLGLAIGLMGLRRKAS